MLKEKDKRIDEEAKLGKVKVMPLDKAKGILTVDQKIKHLKQSHRDDLYKMIYSMIRTAKFINGEEVENE